MEAEWAEIRALETEIAVLRRACEELPGPREETSGAQAEERKDLFMFFRSLHFFVEWYEYRKRTFKHFKEKYPNVVQLSEGASSSCMGLRSTSQPGFELVIVWRIHIDEEGKVLPKLDLLTKIPQQALQLDRKRVTESAPRSFRTLLGVLGIEASLESLIKSLCMEKKD
ncbi:centromere protein P isoform X3 [Tamandua tetradactyla]|uniref:centromere protein P isoform X3 n=1 Tax=Tamandua tetradactyla TaxID=48850 RepID=UPI004053F1C6